MQTLSRPVWPGAFRKLNADGLSEISGVRAEVSKLQTELKTLASRILRLTSEDAVPWSEAEMRLKYKEHIDYLELFFATAREVMVDADKEDLDALIAEYHLYFRDPSSAQEDVWNQIFTLLDDRDIDYAESFASYDPHEVTKWFLRTKHLRAKETDLQLQLDFLKSQQSALLADIEKEKTVYRKECSSLINFLYIGNNFSDVGFREQLKNDSKVKSYIIAADLLSFIHYIKNYYDSTVTDVLISEKVLAWQFMLPKSKEKFNSFFSRWQLEKEACIAAGCPMPSVAVQIQYLSKNILSVHYDSSVVNLFLSQFRLPSDDPNFRRPCESPEQFIDKLMSIVRSTSTNKQVPDLTYTASPLSAPSDEKSRNVKSTAANSSSKDVVTVDHVSAVSVPNKPGPKQSNGQQSKQQQQTRSPSPATSNPNSANLLCGVCKGNHLVVKCPIVLSCPQAQQFYQKMMDAALASRSNKTKYQSHAASIRMLSESLSSNASITDEHDDDSFPNLSYFCLMSDRIAILSIFERDLVMLDSGASAFLFNDASIFSSLDSTPRELKPFKDSVPITVEGHGTVPGLGAAYYDSNCPNIVSFTGLEKAGYCIDARKSNGVTIAFAVHNPVDNTYLLFTLRGATFWCPVSDFFALLRCLPTPSQARPASPSISTLQPVVSRYNLRRQPSAPISRNLIPSHQHKDKSTAALRQEPATTPAQEPRRPTPRKKSSLQVPNFYSGDSDSDSSSAMPIRKRPASKKPRQVRFSATVPEDTASDSVPPLVADSSRIRARFMLGVKTTLKFDI